MKERKSEEYRKEKGEEEKERRGGDFELVKGNI